MIYIYINIHPSIYPNFHTVIQNSIFSLRSHVVSQFEDILSGRAKSSLPVQSHHRARAQPIREKSAISAKNYPWRMNSGWAHGLCIHSITNMFWNYLFAHTHTHRSNHISPLISIGVWAKKHKPYLWVAIVHLPGYQNFIPGYLNGLHAENLWIK